MKLGLITDIHEQFASLGKVLTEAERMGCEELVCLGDIIGFDPDLYPSNGGRNGAGCVRLIKENCRWVVGGNHDRERPDDGHNLSEEDLAYLGFLPESLIIGTNESRILLSHYLYPDFTGSSMVFVRRLNQLNDLFDYMNQEKVGLAFAGHDHPAGVGFGYPSKNRRGSRFMKAFHYMPFRRYELDGQQVVCLLPALANRSGRPGFSVWDTGNGTLDIIQFNP